MKLIFFFLLVSQKTSYNIFWCSTHISMTDNKTCSGPYKIQNKLATNIGTSRSVRNLFILFLLFSLNSALQCGNRLHCAPITTSSGRKSVVKCNYLTSTTMASVTALFFKPKHNQVSGTAKSDTYCLSTEGGRNRDESVVFSTNVEFGWLINLQRAGEQERWSKENKTLDFAISEHLECAEQCECSLINPSTMIFPSDILQTIPCSSNRFFFLKKTRI